MWDRAAPHWERQALFVDEQLAAATEALLDAAGIGAGDDVIEVAAGPGGVALAALERVGPDGSVTISDVAEGMVDVARRRLGERANVRFLVCDQASIPLADASSDAVISRHGLMFADDPVAAVGEAVRVLRPEGRFAAMTWARRADNPWLGIVLDSVGEQFGMPFPPPGIAGPFALDAPEELAGVLERGGLRDVVVSVADTPIPAASLDAWWERVPQLAGPLGAMLEAMDPETRDAIRDRALANARSVARPAGDGISLGGCSLVAAGRR
jgi:SAM-dependent methyltransferase